MKLVLFFMYVFPIFFLGIPVIRMKPLIATIFLIIGIILWIMISLKILSFISGPKKQSKKLQEIQDTGRLVKGEILEAKDMGMEDNFPLKHIKILFPNLGGNLVKTKLEILDSKAHEERYKEGNYVDLKLNRKDFDPALTINGAAYEVKTSPILWVWFIFNLVYAIAFFLLAYYFQNDGYGWRFLNPLHPWVWSPFISLFMLKIFEKSFDSDGILDDFDLKSDKVEDKKGELLLYGKLTLGEIVSYRQTGLYVNEQPQILFNLVYDADGQTIKQEIMDIVNLIDMANLRKGQVEVLYLPRNPEVFTVNFDFNQDLYL